MSEAEFLRTAIEANPYPTAEEYARACRERDQARAEAEKLRARIAGLGDEFARLATSGPQFWGNDFSQAAERSRGRRDAYLHAASLARAAIKPAAASVGLPSPAEFVETLRPQFKTLEQLTAEQGVQPITDVDDLAAAPEDRLSDEEYAAFESALREARGCKRDCCCPGDCEGGPECLDDEGGPLPSRAQVESHTHAAWSDIRSARMDSPAAQAGHQAAADEHNHEEPTS